ncbi:adenylyltransferase/cytidyltransferase family protein [Bacillus subtilis]
MKKVTTYGTFDLFHYGHMKLLESLPFKNKAISTTKSKNT